MRMGLLISDVRDGRSMNRKRGAPDCVDDLCESHIQSTKANVGGETIVVG